MPKRKFKEASTRFTINEAATNITVRIGKRPLARLRQIATDMGVTVGTAIRQAVAEFIESVDT